MAVYIVTGKLGSGKTLVAVGMMRDALAQGRKVATNVDLWMEHLTRWKNRSAVAYRLPDRLQAESFEAIGIGNESYDEEKNGLIVLDEGGLSMNSREYREKGRKEFIRWAIHSRKKGWDIAILIQHYDGLDKQIRDFFGEHVIVCMRMDRMKIPFIGWALKLVGIKGTMPKVHLAICRYGHGQSAVIAWRKMFKGKDLYQAYDTKQAYDPDDEAGVFQYLPAWNIKGYKSTIWEELKSTYGDMFNEYFSVRLGRLPVFFCAMILGGVVHAKFNDEPETVTVEIPAEKEPEPVKSQPIKSEGVSLSGLFGSGESEAVEEKTIEQIWETAYIGSNVSIPSENYHWYSFRNENGEKLEVPGGWRVTAVSACQAIVKSGDKKYFLGCGK